MLPRYTCNAVDFTNVLNKHCHQVEESDVLKRLLPGKMEVWKRKRDKRLERKRKAKEKKVNEWVSVILLVLKKNVWYNSSLAQIWTLSSCK